MKTISRQITGDITVEEDSQYNNIIAENVIVGENFLARFYGVVKGNLHLKPGAIVYLHGKLNGKLINEGGTLYVYTASGEIETYNKES